MVRRPLRLVATSRLCRIYSQRLPVARHGFRVEFRWNFRQGEWTLYSGESNALLSRVKEPRALEANLQNLAVVADEPSRPRIRKSDRPVTAHVRQLKPGLSFVWTPGGCAGGEVRLSLRRDHDGAVVFVAGVVSIPPIIVVFNTTHIGETEDCSWNRGLGRKRPLLSAITRSCRLRSAVVGQVAATHNAVPWIAERYREGACIGVAHEWSVICIPGVSAIASRQDSSDT